MHPNLLPSPLFLLLLLLLFLPSFLAIIQTDVHRAVNLFFFSLSLQTAMNPPTSPLPAHNKRVQQHKWQTQTKSLPFNLKFCLFKSNSKPVFFPLSFRCVNIEALLGCQPPLYLLAVSCHLGWGLFQLQFVLQARRTCSVLKHWAFQGDLCGHARHVRYCFMGDWAAFTFWL